MGGSRARPQSVLDHRAPGDNLGQCPRCQQAALSRGHPGCHPEGDQAPFLSIRGSIRTGCWDHVGPRMEHSAGAVPLRRTHTARTGMNGSPGTFPPLSAPSLSPGAGESPARTSLPGRDFLQQAWATSSRLCPQADGSLLQAGARPPVCKHNSLAGRAGPSPGSSLPGRLESTPGGAALVVTDGASTGGPAPPHSHGWSPPQGSAAQSVPWVGFSPSSGSGPRPGQASNLNGKPGQVGAFSHSNALAPRPGVGLAWFPSWNPRLEPL